MSIIKVLDHNDAFVLSKVHSGHFDTCADFANSFDLKGSIPKDRSA